MAGNGIYLRDFMAKLATRYPIEYRRIRDIIDEVYDNLMVDIEMHRERIARYDAEERSLATVRRTLREDDASPIPSPGVLSPPLDPQAFRFSGNRQPDTPAAGFLVPQPILYSATSNGRIANDPDTGSPVLLLNTPTPNPVPGRAPRPSSRSPLHHQNVPITATTTTQTTPPGDAATRVNPGINQDGSPQSQISNQTRNSTPSKRAFNSTHGPGGDSAGEEGGEEENGAEEPEFLARDAVKEPVVDGVKEDISDEDASPLEDGGPEKVNGMSGGSGSV